MVVDIDLNEITDDRELEFFFDDKVRKVWHKQEEERLLADIVAIEKEKAVVEQIKQTVFAPTEPTKGKSITGIGDSVFDALK